MPIIKKSSKTIIVAIILFLSANSYCAVNDGFGASREVEAKNFTVYYSPDVEISRLVRQLNVQSSDKVLAGKSLKGGLTSEEELAEMLDTLFIQVCDVLDMNLYSFSGNIKICRDYEQLNKVHNSLFRKDLQSREAFYVQELKTIYISVGSFQRGILAHEIGHAVICHYFVVMPPMKIQEVLAMYVEYQLRKAEQ